MLQYHQICISKDNVQFETNVVVFYRVADSLKLAYRMGSNHLQEGVKEIAEGLLRSVAGQNTLQSIIENRSLVSKKLTELINKMVAYWGIYVQTTSLKGISTLSQKLDCKNRSKKPYRLWLRPNEIAKLYSSTIAHKSPVQLFINRFPKS